MLPHFVSRTLIISFAFKTDKHMTNLNISEESMYNIIKSLNLNISYCCGGILIKFIQLSGKSITRFLKLIFKFFSVEGIFLDAWKKGSITPVHKKRQKKAEKLQTNSLKTNLLFYMPIIVFYNILIFYIKLSVTLT